MTTRTITGANDVELAVESVGRGPPILLLHGFSQSRMSWTKQFESDLTDEFQLVAPDLRGHGASEKPRDAYDEPSDWARDIEAVLDAFELDDVLLVGWSYAGLIALDYISNMGTDRLAGLHLVAAISSIGTETANDRLGRAYVDLIPGLVSESAEESIQALAAFVDLCVAGSLPPEEKYFQLGYNVVVPPHVRDSLRARSISYDDSLAALDLPVFLSHGEEDAVILPKTTRQQAQRITDVERSTYPDTGHSPFWERPGRFNRELRAFRERL